MKKNKSGMDGNLTNMSDFGKALERMICYSLFMQKGICRTDYFNGIL
ncbi:MAG: hypothetical protein Q4F83_02350 [Eubacteriales bacterium]|nr:hypothetical protein [Eubacteriales bacterium]